MIGISIFFNVVQSSVEKNSSETLITNVTQQSEHLNTILNINYSYLNVLDSEEKDPGPMAKAMSHIKTSMKLMPTPTDMEIAELMYDGCNMGVKSLYKYLRQYKGANGDSKKLTEKIIKCEEDLRETVKEFI